MPAVAARAEDERAVRDLYRSILDRWNRRDASEFAALFADDANMVGRSLRDGTMAGAAVCQNTPAAFHGRPQLGVALTNELRELL